MAVLEVLCHEILPGDIRKIQAQSNDSNTGGGARDLRFSKEKFGSALDRLFSTETVAVRDIQCRIGEFAYIDESGQEKSVDRVLYAFQPTSARPTEVRIAQISKLPFMRGISKYSSEDGSLFIAFVRMDKGVPHAHLLTEKQIANPKSNRQIARAMREAKHACRQGSAVIFDCFLGWREEDMSDLLNNEMQKILRLLAEEKNVLLSGAPATGKTTLLNLVEEAFCQGGETDFDPMGEAAFPLVASTTGCFPGDICQNRKVFRTTFHQGTRYRDFVRGLIPRPGGDSVHFEVSEGLLWNASEFAKQEDSAALVIIDEINRGPAVSIFGDMISAFEADKRLDDNNQIIPGKTVTVQALNDQAELVDYQLPSRLYFLAAMNQADSSVEPMDAAFLRRWHEVKLLPSCDELYTYFGLEPGKVYPLAPQPSTSQDVYAAAVAAFSRINEQIVHGRGEDYQIGHGVLMKKDKDKLPETIDGALEYVLSCWPVIESHIDEVFFNDKEAIAEVLNAHDDSFYRVSSFDFAGRQTIVIQHEALKKSNVYQMLTSITA